MPNQVQTRSLSGTVPVPVSLFQLLKHVRLAPLESVVFFHIVELSLNFQYGGRKFISLSATELSYELECSDRMMRKVLERLEKSGIVEAKESIIKTRGGVQRSKIYAIASREKIDKLVNSIPKKVGTISSDLVNVDNSEVGTLSSDLWNSQFRPLGTLSSDLRNSQFLPWTLKDLKLNRKAVPEECIKNINNFIKKYSTFEFSIYDLLSMSEKSTRVKSKFKMNFAGISSQWGDFKASMAMTAYIFNRGPKNVDFEAIKRYLKNNNGVLDSKWSDLLKDIDEVYFELVDLDNFCKSKNLKFKDQAYFKLISVKENYNLLNTHEAIIDDLVLSHQVSSNIGMFRDCVEGQINLYFKAKLLGHNEVSFETSSL